MKTTRFKVACALIAPWLLLPGSCGEAFLNQTASLGGSTAGLHGSVRIVVINNTPHRAVFTVGTYTQTDPTSTPGLVQFAHRESGRRLDGDSSSDVFSIGCARVFSIGGPDLLHLIEETVSADMVDEVALVAGVKFFDVASGEEEDDNGAEEEPVLVGTAPPFEALLGVDFPCEALLIIRLEFDDLGPDPFRVDFELIPSESRG